MVCRRGHEWEFVTVLKSMKNGQHTMKCKYCSHTWDGGPSRIRAHVLGLKGAGVSTCPSAPQNVKEMCRKLQANVAISDQDVLDAEVANLGDASDNQTESVGCANVAGASSSARNSAHKKPKMSKGALAKSWEMQAHKDATIALRRFFFAEDVAHWKVRSPYFLDMIKAIGKAGPSYKPPSYHHLRTKELDDEVKCMDRDLLGLQDKWKKYGCSIVCDGWSDTRKRPIINIMVSCMYGSAFLRSVDTSGLYKSREYIFEILKHAILDVGPDNVVQVCMDNASNCVRAGELVEIEWPHIFYTRCTCHCLDLLFEDIGNLAWVKSTLADAEKVVSFITRKPTMLAIYRKFSKKELVKPAQTRFAYMFIVLANLLDERVFNGLRRMVVSDEYCRKKVSRTVKALEVSSIILGSQLWTNAKLLVKICAPILKILRLADREGATMGLVYELTDRMVEKVEGMQGVEPSKLAEIKELCVGRWNMMHSPLHAAAFVLHPIWRSKCPDGDREVNNGWMDVIERYTKYDIEQQGILCDELDKYKSESGIFARPIAKDEKRMHQGVKWWETFGADTPHLQRLALRVLSQGTCASPCERNWSTFSRIHTKLRNKLLPKNTEKLAYIHTNLRLISKIKDKGYEKIEVTLEMLNMEKDDDRLLALQAQTEGEEEDVALAQPNRSADVASSSLAEEDEDDEEEDEEDDEEDEADNDSAHEEDADENDP